MKLGPLAAKQASARHTTARELTNLRTAVGSRRPETYLHPGQSHVAVNPVVLKMILGSCAGVFLFNPILAISGATHFMLPRHEAGQPSPRYGDVAIAGLLEKFLALGSKPQNIQAKVFGGASMLVALRDVQGAHFGHIGQRNVETALDILAQASIPVVEKNVFGNRGRKVSMVSDTGQIAHEFVSASDGN